MSIISELGGLGGGSIGRASVDLILNTTVYNAQLAEAEAKTTAASSKMQGGLSGAISNIRSSLGAGGQAALAFGAVVAVAVTSAVSVTQKWASSVRELQRVTGQTAEDASKLAAAGEILGLDVTKLSTGFGLLAKNIVNGSANMTKYGIATRDAQGNVLPFNDVLANVSDKFAQLQPGAEQTAFAMNVFGRSGKDLIPILQRGSAGLNELYDSAQKAGLVMSQDDLNASKALTIAQRQLGEAVKGVAIQIGKVFVPVFTSAVKALRGFIEVVKSVASTVGAALKPVFDFIGKSAKDFGKAFGDFGAALGELGKQFAAAFAPLEPVLKPLLALLAGPLLATILGLGLALEALAKTFELAAQGTRLFVDLVGPVFASAMNLAIRGVNALIGALNVVIDASNRWLRTNIDNIPVIAEVATGSKAASDAVDHLAGAQDAAAAATRHHTLALQAQRLELLTAAGGVLGLVGSMQQAQDAQDTYNQLVRQGKQGTAAFSEAVVNATTTQLAFKTQVRQFIADHPGQPFDEMRQALKEFATQQGISASDFRSTFGAALDDISGRIDNFRAKARQPITFTADVNISGPGQRILDQLNRSGI